MSNPWRTIGADSLPEGDGPVEIRQGMSITRSSPGTLRRYVDIYGEAETMQWRYVEEQVAPPTNLSTKKKPRRSR